MCSFTLNTSASLITLFLLILLFLSVYYLPSLWVNRSEECKINLSVWQSKMMFKIPKFWYLYKSIYQQARLSVSVSTARTWIKGSEFTKGTIRWPHPHHFCVTACFLPGFLFLSHLELRLRQLWSNALKTLHISGSAAVLLWCSDHQLGLLVPVVISVCHPGSFTAESR